MIVLATLSASIPMVNISLLCPDSLPCGIIWDLIYFLNLVDGLRVYNYAHKLEDADVLKISEIRFT